MDGEDFVWRHQDGSKPSRPATAKRAVAKCRYGGSPRKETHRNHRRIIMGIKIMRVFRDPHWKTKKIPSSTAKAPVVIRIIRKTDQDVRLIHQSESDRTRKTYLVKSLFECGHTWAAMSERADEGVLEWDKQCVDLFILETCRRNPLETRWKLRSNGRRRIPLENGGERRRWVTKA